MSPALDVAINDNIEMNQAKKTAYRSTIGSLLYLAIKTTPDVALAASVFGQFVENPTQP